MFLRIRDRGLLQRLAVKECLIKSGCSQAVVVQAFVTSAQKQSLRTTRTTQDKPCLKNSNNNK